MARKAQSSLGHAVTCRMRNPGLGALAGCEAIGWLGRFQARIRGHAVVRNSRILYRQAPCLVGYRSGSEIKQEPSSSSVQRNDPRQSTSST